MIQAPDSIGYEQYNRFEKVIVLIAFAVEIAALIFILK